MCVFSGDLSELLLLLFSYLLVNYYNCSREVGGDCLDYIVKESSSCHGVKLLHSLLWYVQEAARVSEEKYYIVF